VPKVNPPLSLTLFVSLIRANNPDHTFSANNFAFNAHFSYGCPDLHERISSVSFAGFPWCGGYFWFIPISLKKTQ
jgi:hypothetical protein